MMKLGHTNLLNRVKIRTLFFLLVLRSDLSYVWSTGSNVPEIRDKKRSNGYMYNRAGQFLFRFGKSIKKIKENKGQIKHVLEKRFF